MEELDRCGSWRDRRGVILSDHSDVDFEVKQEDRIVQIILEMATTPETVEVADLDSTTREDGGFGSTCVRWDSKFVCFL